jgi:hypothetical protein
MAVNAFEDPSSRSNPRMPLMSELAGLFWSAYRGRRPAKATAAPEEMVMEGASV